MESRRLVVPAVRCLHLYDAVWTILALALPAPALAHLTRDERQTTRFLEVVVGAGRVELTCAIAFGERPANGERRAMDLDHDGLVSSAEEEAYGARLALRVRDDVRVKVDGREVRPSWRPGLELLDRRVGTIAFLAALRATLPLAAGAHGIEIEDRLALPLQGEIEIGLREAPGGRFVDSARGEAPPSAERALRFSGAVRTLMEDRRARFRFEVDAAPPAPAASSKAPPSRFGVGRAVALALVLLAAGALLAWLLRRARRRDPAARDM